LDNQLSSEQARKLEQNQEHAAKPEFGEFQMTLIKKYYLLS